ncbi:MAG: alpha-rhamnosidase [Bacteroidales bacterium]|nr:alpha-rhamnosidase [Bacteroidales bacterium]
MATISDNSSVQTSKATWIWYPGDFEIWLGNRFNNRRTERGGMFPPFWKQDSHWATVEFSKSFTLEKDETLHITAEGSYNLMLDGKLQFGQPKDLILPAGEHKLNIKVHNLASPPALFIKGTTVHTDASWLVTYEDKIWIDENGVAHGSGIYVHPGFENFDSAGQLPSQYRLRRKTVAAVSMEPVKKGMLYDFGKETFGYVRLATIDGQGTVGIYYGESREEALDTDYCETLDRVEITQESITDLATGTVCPYSDSYTLPSSKAFRYIYVVAPKTLLFEVSADYEYNTFNTAESGFFHSYDNELSKIWRVSAHTMDLTTREFFLDGIKRDRWTWSGDAIQSYLMNYYLRFNSRLVRRTIRQLRGKDPVTAHVNTIMDYSFYWFKSVYDYYFHTGDVGFVREIYPRMRSLMDYCLERLDQDGMAAGQPDDWIFVDWTDFPMPKRGVMCFEQILFCKALETMKLCAELLCRHPLSDPPQGSLSRKDYEADIKKYDALFNSLLKKTKKLFWSKKLNAFMHNMDQGKVNPMITKFPNMFAILYDYVSPQEKKEILRQVLLNDKIEKITTPYMRFYELEALCEMGQQESVLKEIKAYWGGMIREGATSFWEKYNPQEKGLQHLAMYGRPYGKSLCHAWGASPIYLLGKYFLGVRPTSPGYATFEIKPCLAGQRSMNGRVPTPHGIIEVAVYSTDIYVTIPEGKGELVFYSNCQPVCETDPVRRDLIDRKCYRLKLTEPYKKYHVHYEAI